MTSLINLPEAQKNLVIESIRFISKPQQIQRIFINQGNQDLGKYLAVQLHLNSKFRIEQDSDQNPAIFQTNGV